MPVRLGARRIRGMVVLVATFVALLISVLPAAPSAWAGQEPGLAAQIVAAINGDRSAAGLSAYALAADLSAVAAQHSAVMAADQTLFHNPDLGSQVANWQALGENVGDGPSVASLDAAFLSSPEHRANILSAAFTQVGVGVFADSAGNLWVTEDFRRPLTAAAPPAPPVVSVPSGGAAAPPTGAVPRIVTAPVVRPLAVQVAAALLAERFAAMARRAAVIRANENPIAQAVAFLSNMTFLMGREAGAGAPV